jgi:hypothetical protein
VPQAHCELNVGKHEQFDVNMKNPLALMQVRAFPSGLDWLRLVEPTSKGWHSLREEKHGTVFRKGAGIAQHYAQIQL